MYTTNAEITDPPEAIAQAFRTAIASTGARGYMEHTTIYRWLNGVGDSTRAPDSLFIDLDLPDLAVQMDEAFQKISEAHREAVSSPTSL